MEIPVTDDAKLKALLKEIEDIESHIKLWDLEDYPEDFRVVYHDVIRDLRSLHLSISDMYDHMGDYK